MLLENRSVEIWETASWCQREAYFVDVMALQCTRTALLLIHEGGQISTWTALRGGPRQGWQDGRTVPIEARMIISEIGVREAQATEGAFCAILNDGRGACWGQHELGGICQGSHVIDSKIVAVQATASAFAAILHDGRLLAWGNASGGGELTPELRDWRIKRMQWSALVGVAGETCKNRHGRSPEVVENNIPSGQRVTQVQATCFAFAALTEDGQVHSWGAGLMGGTPLEKAPTQKKVTSIQSTYSAFAALHDDGSVTAWGNPSEGGRMMNKADHAEGWPRVVAIQSTNSAFAALCEDGSVRTWGNPDEGGLMEIGHRDITHLLQGVQHLQRCDHSFGAVRKDGTLLLWGRMQQIVPMDTMEPVEKWRGEVGYRPSLARSEPYTISDSVFLIETSGA